jgi:hypothetical protein
MTSPCDMMIIIMAFQELVFNTATEMDTGKLLRLVNRMLTQLQYWHKELPALLSVRGQPVPQVLLLR